jgi:hypothetical protein
MQGITPPVEPPPEELLPSDVPESPDSPVVVLPLLLEEEVVEDVVEDVLSPPLDDPPTPSPSSSPHDTSSADATAAQRTQEAITIVLRVRAYPKRVWRGPRPPVTNCPG